MDFDRNEDRLRDAALELNRGGWRVFPVTVTAGANGSLAKKPCIRGYHGNSTYAPTEIRGWPWQKATALGWALPAGYVLLDVDIKGGKQGETHLGQLQEAEGVLPPTAGQVTLSGGRHLVFKVPLSTGAFYGTVPLADGSRADIDICHARHRYMRIYDLAIFEQQIADLPDNWVKLITKNPGQTRATDRTASTHRGSAVTLDDLVRAGDGSRNTTLNQLVFAMALKGEFNSNARDQIVEIALGLGLGDDEINATITSATSAVKRAGQEPSKWLKALDDDERLFGRRHRPSVLMAAGHLSHLAIQHGMTVGLSVRDLGERLGTSHVSASKVLKMLKKYGYLRRESLRDRENANQYRLVIPRVNIHHHAEPAGTKGGMLTFANRQGLDFYAHDAFIRLRGGRNLPKSCAIVLASVYGGGTTVEAIATVVPYSASTVRRALHLLEAASLVIYDSRNSRKIRALSGDPTARLDRWADWSGAAGSADWLRTRHINDRKLNADAIAEPQSRSSWEGKIEEGTSTF